MWIDVRTGHASLCSALGSLTGTADVDGVS